MLLIIINGERDKRSFKFFSSPIFLEKNIFCHTPTRIYIIIILYSKTRSRIVFLYHLYQICGLLEMWPS